MYLLNELAHVRSFTNVESEWCIVECKRYSVVVVFWLVDTRMNQCLIEIQHQCLLDGTFDIVLVDATLI